MASATGVRRIDENALHRALALVGWQVRPTGGDAVGIARTLLRSGQGIGLRRPAAVRSFVVGLAGRRLCRRLWVSASSHR